LIPAVLSGRYRPPSAGERETACCQETEMLRRRPEPDSTTTIGPAFADFHDWVLSLPWVVERPYSLDTPGVRCFGVDCEPLGRRQLWMMTGLQRQLDADGVGLAVIVPAEIASEIEEIGWGNVVAPMPSRHVLVTVRRDSVASRQDLEAVVLTAYTCAMSEAHRPEGPTREDK
jgi:hypothetical protein